MQPVQLARPYFFVDGPAVPQGSKRAPIAGVVRESSKGLHAWREKVALCARAAGWTGAPKDVPVAVGLLFVRPRPRSHLSKDGRVLSTAPAFPTAKPDGDKLERAVLDALTRVCWSDDSRVVLVRRFKLFGDREGVGVLVLPITTVRPGTADLRGLHDPHGLSSTLAALSWWPPARR